MSNDYGRDGTELLADVVNGALYNLLVLLVESTRCLVQQEDLGLLDEGSSNGNPLLLTT